MATLLRGRCAPIFAQQSAQSKLPLLAALSIQAMKQILLTLTLLYSALAFSSDFESRLSQAMKVAEIEPGKTYEQVVRESTWDINSSCFHESAKVRATPGYYQLVASINSQGIASHIMVKPEHHYSSCVAKWFSENTFANPPKDNWPIFLNVNIQP
ncbi:hypothetical protein HXX02_00110 [Microbulbifer elongatus]|uniref:Uncharacterized protein n=1 Tax=Microbulbifer elongatus TaxID=86173 RepID=A0ABT1NVF9_9GAMM|nr:hypothetical protein [Microbulbifer elongatus]MCQ3827838.1 hypothetical protein [Microbulbifer elongatus]